MRVSGRGLAVEVDPLLSFGLGSTPLERRHMFDHITFGVRVLAGPRPSMVRYFGTCV